MGLKSLVSSFLLFMISADISSRLLLTPLYAQKSSSIYTLLVAIFFSTIVARTHLCLWLGLWISTCIDQWLLGSSSGCKNGHVWPPELPDYLTFILHLCLFGALLPSFEIRFMSSYFFSSLFLINLLWSIIWCFFPAFGTTSFTFCCCVIFSSCSVIDSHTLCQITGSFRVSYSRFC